MWANNEVGTVQPIAELAAVAHEYAGSSVHTDAVQALGALPVDFAASGVDALTVTGHKVGGPVGVGALLLRPRVRARADPARRRPGARRALRHPRRAGHPRLRDRRRISVEAARPRPSGWPSCATTWSGGCTEAVPDAVLNGPPPGPDRLPGNAHFSFPGCEGDALLMLLDARGIECSTGSACSAGVAQPSHVLLAMGADEDRARGSLRFSLGHTSTEADVDVLGAAIGAAVERARRAASR